MVHSADLDSCGGGLVAKRSLAVEQWSYGRLRGLISRRKVSWLALKIHEFSTHFKEKLRQVCKFYRCI